MTSIIILPTFSSLLSASENVPNGSLLRGILWSSIITPMLIIVAVYGLAILLNVQWLRFAGIYSVLYLFAKAWIMLLTWLSTSSTYWGMIVNPTLNFMASFVCVLLTPVLFYAWQRRNQIEMKQCIYCAGMIVSFDLFLIFSFLFEFVVSSSTDIGLNMSFKAINFLVLAGIAVIPLAWWEKLKQLQKIAYLFVLFFFCSEIWASSILLMPVFYSMVLENSWVASVLGIIYQIAIYTPFAMLIGIVALIVKARKVVRAKLKKG